MRCPHCGSSNRPHIPPAAIVLTDEKHLYCFDCGECASYEERCQEEIAKGQDTITVEARAEAGNVAQKLVEIELRIHRREDKTLDYIGVERHGYKTP